MGHSMGGIAARWYIEKEGGKDFVSRLFLMASPWNGAPKAMHTIFRGIDMFMRSRFNPLKIRELTRRTVRSFPSAYQILPHQDFYLRDDAGRQFDPYANTEWLENDTQRALLADARKFNQELGNTLSVETLCFFGRKHPTVDQGIALIDPTGLWDDITWESSPSGDGTVPEASAVHEAAQQKLPFVAPTATSTSIRRCSKCCNGSCGTVSSRARPPSADPPQHVVGQDRARAVLPGAPSG